MSSREDILASIRQHTQTRYDKPDIAEHPPCYTREI